MQWVACRVSQITNSALVSYLRGEVFDDFCGFDADIDNALYGCDEVSGVLEPAVWVVYDTAVFVLRDLVAVDEPFQRGVLPLTTYRCASSGIPDTLDMLVDDEGCSFLLIGEPHCSFAKQKMFGFFFPK